MRKVLAAALLVLGATAASAQRSGKALFDAEGCRACHSIGGVGGNAGPDLTFVGFRHSPQWLDRWLQSPRAWKKGTRMPEFRLPPDERAALVEYLSSLKGQDFGTRHWTDGKVIFNKAGCVACHGALGHGGFPNNNVPGSAIPALTAVADTYTPEELRRKITEGSHPDKLYPNGPEPLVFMPAWGQVLTPAEIDAVASYVLTLTPKNEKAEF